MRIKEAIKIYSKKVQGLYGSFCVPTDEDGYWNINVMFINSHDERDDETQFDIKPSNFDYAQGKCQELEELWKDFCKENGLKQNSVTEIYFANLEQEHL